MSSYCSFSLIFITDIGVRRETPAFIGNSTESSSRPIQLASSFPLGSLALEAQSGQVPVSTSSLTEHLLYPLVKEFYPGNQKLKSNRA